MQNSIEPMPVLFRRSRADHLHSCAAARHNHHVLLVYTEGVARMKMTEEIRCEPGNMVLIPAGMSHEMRNASPVLSATGVGFQAGPELSRQFDANLMAPFDRIRSGSLPIGSVPVERQSFIESLFNELASESRRDTPEAASAAQHLLALLLIEARRVFQNVHNDGPNQAVTLATRALRFIEEHCLRPISLADVADALGRSPAHVTTAVRVATGQPVLAWILAGRMHEARRRLFYSNEPIESIAEHTGYADATHFTRLFRREHGVTPAAWRKRARSG